MTGLGTHAPTLALRLIELVDPAWLSQTPGLAVIPRRYDSTLADGFEFSATSGVEHVCGDAVIVPASVNVNLDQRNKEKSTEF